MCKFPDFGRGVHAGILRISHPCWKPEGFTACHSDFPGISSDFTGFQWISEVHAETHWFDFVLREDPPSADLGCGPIPANPTCYSRGCTTASPQPPSRARTLVNRFLRIPGSCDPVCSAPDLSLTHCVCQSVSTYVCRAPVRQAPKLRAPTFRVHPTSGDPAGNLLSCIQDFAHSISFSPPC